VLAAMAGAAGLWANPASAHALGRAARSVIEGARERLAEVLSVHPRDVVFTSGGTEANNLALHQASLLVTSRLEHPSVVKIAEQLEPFGRTRWLPVRAHGRVEPADVAAALVDAPSGTWVSVAAANHETGVIHPIAEIAAVARRGGARLHVDAVQALGKMELMDLAGADAVSVCAHKIRGPKGIGALAWRHGAAPTPFLRGGAQERGLRPGSQDAVLAIGFQAALEGLDVEAHRAVAELRNRIERWLAARGSVNGDVEHRLPHVTNVSVNGWRADELIAALDLRGVCVSAGSACSAGTVEPSPVITSMLGRDRSLGAVRISLGVETTEREVETALLVLEDVLRGTRSE
jgi:cysteine desulfurase